jgi:hypothetical protein
MMRRLVTSRFHRGLLIAGMIGVIAGLPFLCITSNTQPIVLSETEDATAGKCSPFKSDCSDFVADFSVVDPATAPVFQQRVADEWAEMESSLTESYLQRGPPGC